MRLNVTAPEVAYSTGDEYIRRLFQAQTITEVTAVKNQMYQDFIEKVHACRIHAIPGRLFLRNVFHGTLVVKLAQSCLIPGNAPPAAARRRRYSFLSCATPAAWSMPLPPRWRNP